MTVKNKIILGGVIAVVLSFSVASVIYARGVFKANSGPCHTPVTDSAVHTDTVIVTLCSDGYHPADLKVKKDVKVTFRTELPHAHWPASNNHPSHTLYPDFDPKQPIPQSEEWSFVFEKVGKWGFHDHIRSPYVGTIEAIE